MKYDISVGSNAETGLVDIAFLSSIVNIEITGMGYDDAEELRDMITDVLEHLDECGRQKNPPEPDPVSRVGAAYAAYLTGKWKIE